MSANDEVSELKAERDALEDDALLRTRRALTTIKNTEGIAQDTLSTLQTQGEQLTIIEEKSRMVNANTQLNYEKTKDVKKYGKFFNFSFTTFLNRKKKKIDREYTHEMATIAKEAEDDKLKQRQRIIEDQLRQEKKVKKELTKSKDKADESRLPKEETEKGLEIDRNLNEISNMTKNLTDMALGMSRELDDQKVTLAKVGAHNKHAEQTLERSEKKIEKYS